MRHFSITSKPPNSPSRQFSRKRPGAVVLFSRTRNSILSSEIPRAALTLASRAQASPVGRAGNTALWSPREQCLARQPPAGAQPCCWGVIRGMKKALTGRSIFDVPSCDWGNAFREVASTPDKSIRNNRGSTLASVAEQVRRSDGSSGISARQVQRTRRYPSA